MLWKGGVVMKLLVGCTVDLYKGRQGVRIWGTWGGNLGTWGEGTGREGGKKQ